MAGTLVANTINTDTGLFSTNNAYSGIAKAWVNYKATTQTITGSFNVSSVTYISTGQFTINFATAMTDATYAIAGTTGGSNAYDMLIADYISANTTTSFTVVCATAGAGGYINPTQVNLVVFR